MIVHRETILQATVNDTVAVTHERSTLTPTEGRVFCLMGMLTNKQIAHKLGISEQTVKNHITSILEKLGAGDRTQAVVIGIGSGLLKVSVEYTPEETR
ncbi:MAG: LuxR C-terminal-related transcriptional regulator [Patescibacteria group bacterium]